MVQMRIKVVAVGLTLFEMETLETMFRSSKYYELVGLRSSDQANVVIVNVDDEQSLYTWKSTLDRPDRATVFVAGSPDEYAGVVTLERRLLDKPRFAKQVLAALDASLPKQLVLSLETPVCTAPAAKPYPELPANKPRFLGKVASWFDGLRDDGSMDNPYYS